MSLSPTGDNFSYEELSPATHMSRGGNRQKAHEVITRPQAKAYLDGPSPGRAVRRHQSMTDRRSMQWIAGPAGIGA